MIPTYPTKVGSVHIAGPAKSGEDQLCARCGCLLKVAYGGHAYWAEGSLLIHDDYGEAITDKEPNCE